MTDARSGRLPTVGPDGGEGSSGAVAAADLRLVIPAIVAWAAAAAAPAIGPGPSLWVALAVAVAVAVAVGLSTARASGLLAARRRRSPGRGPRTVRQRRVGPDGGRAAPGGAARTWLPALAAALLCGAAALAGTALRADSRASGPVADLAAGGAAVRAELILTGDPVLQRGAAPRRADLVIVRARTVQITGRGTGWLVRQPVLILAREDGWLGLLPGSRVMTNGRLQPARDGDDVAAVLSASGRPVQTRAPPMLQRSASALRAAMRDAAARLSDRERGLLPGLVDGDVSGLDPDVSDEFRAAGLSHLTAVSGANCAIVLAVVLTVARRVRLGRWPAGILGLLALGFFVLLARPSPSVLRASITGALGVVAVATGRTRAALPALGCSVLVLVLMDPALARSPGFALSVAATAGIVVLAPGWRVSLRRRLPAPVADAVAVAAAAQIACTPVLAAMGSTMSLVAVPANLLAAPAVAPATVLGIVAAGAQLIWSPLSALPTQLAGLACRWLVAVAHVSAGVSAGRLPLPGGVAGFLVAVAATVSLVFLVRRRRTRRPLGAVVAGLLVANIALVPILHVGWPPRGWQLVACDVGQGDALVINAGAGGYVLVDAGPDPGLMRSCLSQLGVGALALVVITHDHSDHVEGLPGVLGRMPVGGVAVGPLREPALEWDRLRRWAGDAGVAIRTLSTGTTFALGQSSWQVLGPRTVLHGTDSDPNNASLVLRVQLPALSILLTGDAEQPLQDQLLQGVPLSADVLKVPHHGSDRQESSFLHDVHARTAIVSVGAGNSYGHPSMRTIGLLERDGAAVFRTDTSGAIAVLRAQSGLLTVVPRGERHVSVNAAGPPARARDRVRASTSAMWRRTRAPPALSTSRRQSCARACSTRRLETRRLRAALWPRDENEP